MRTLALMGLLAVASASAGEVYKCKGPNGEVTFTNIKCPEKSQAQHYGSYAPTKDDPVQGAQASAAAAAIHERDAPAIVDPFKPSNHGIVDPFKPAVDQRAAMSDAAAVANEDPRSAAGRNAREARLKQQSADEDAKRWADSRLGAPRDAADEQQDDADRTAQRDAALSNKPEARITGCTQSGYSVNCRKDDGTMAHGSALGGHVWDDKGNATQIKRDPFTGAKKTEDGVCVKDIYGNCI